MGKVMQHTHVARLNIRHNLSSSKAPKPLQLKLLTTYIPKTTAFTLAFSTSQRLRTTTAHACFRVDVQGLDATGRRAVHCERDDLVVALVNRVVQSAEGAGLVASRASEDAVETRFDGRLIGSCEDDLAELLLDLVATRER